MALLAMACWDTDDNKRSSMTDECLHSLSKTVALGKGGSHRLIVFNNGSCFKTFEVLKKWENRLTRMSVIHSRENIGQAAAINRAWSHRKPGESLCRFDNDVQFKTTGWLEDLEEVIRRDPLIGIAALKHADLPDCPEAEGWAKTEYRTLSHRKGERHMIVEIINHCLGAVQLINPELFDQIGYLKQFGKWGGEDYDYAVRCSLAGFRSVYAHVGYFNDLDKDKVEAYQEWKNAEAASHQDEMDRVVAEYRNGSRPLYCEA